MKKPIEAEGLADPAQPERRALMKLGAAAGIAAPMVSPWLMQAALAAAAPVRGGTLNIVHGSINILNPAIQSGIATMIPGAQLFAGLVEYDADWKPHPYLATHWEQAADGLSHTFHLRQGALFHDGHEITSEDVAFSLHIVKNYHPFGPAMFGSVDRVDTPDKYTAIIRLKQPLPALLVSTSSVLLPIIPKHVYGVGDIHTNPANNRPVGSGPFKFQAYSPGEYLILERFDKFFRPGRPYLDRLVFHIMHDPNTSTLGMQRGKLDYMPYAPVTISDVERLAKTPHLAVTHGGYAAVGPLNWLAFNVRHKPLSDKRVRQAIAYASSRKFIVDDLFEGKAKIATGPIAPSSPFYSPDVPMYAQNLAKANALLDQAGYPKKGDGTRFTLTLDVYPSMGQVGLAPAQYFKAQLPKVGIAVNIREAPDFPTWAHRMANWDFELSMDEVYNYPDPTIGVQRTYMSTNIKHVVWSNTQGYSNPHVDALFEQAAHEGNFDKRKALYSELQKILADDLPVYWINVIPYSTVYNQKVQNVPLTIWGAMGPMDQVWLRA